MDGYALVLFQAMVFVLCFNASEMKSTLVQIEIV